MSTEVANYEVIIMYLFDDGYRSHMMNGVYAEVQDGGTLVFYNGEHKLVGAFAAGRWKQVNMVE
jgi:hypothetical protein